MFESARLLGSDATELGEVDSAQVRTSRALAVSRGRFTKGYSFTDPKRGCLFRRQSTTKPDTATHNQKRPKPRS